MTKQYDVLAFIGRFQPFHNGHKTVVDAALGQAKKVAIIIGSHDQPRTSRNPFTTAERVKMITSVYPEEVKSGRIQFVAQVDHLYNITRWIASIEAAVMTVSQTPFNPDPVKLGLIGHSKDDSSFYLKSFPTWDSVEVSNYFGINATNIRESYFKGHRPTTHWLMPGSVMHWMYEWQMSDEYNAVRAEHDFLIDYRKQWENSPYPPTFFTADALVTYAGYILLIERGAAPGKGLWAMPGGFVNPYEDSRDASVRELREETRLAVPDKVLYGSIRQSRLYQDPYRSERGRTISMVYRFDLTGDALPKVKGSDDAKKARWIPLDSMQRSVMFEDHFDVIANVLGV